MNYTSAHKQISDIAFKIRENPIHVKELLDQQDKYHQRLKPGEYRSILPENLYFLPEMDITVFLHYIFPFNPFIPLQERLQKATTQQHSHDFFEISYLSSGICYAFVEENQYIMQPGSLFILNTQQKHEVVIDNEETNLFNILVRKSTFSNTIMDMLGNHNLLSQFFIDSVYSKKLKPDYLHFQIIPNSKQEIYLSFLFQEYLKRDEFSQNNMLNLFGCLLSELSRELVLQQNNSKNKVLNMTKLMSYINKNYLTVSLKELSEQFSYSQNYISQSIMRYTGKSFISIIQEKKWNYAKQLLKSRDLTMDIIASMLNYHNRSSFEIAFKKEFGITPKQYRQKSNKN